GIEIGSPVPTLANRAESLSPDEREEYEAAIYMYGYAYHRNMCNFAHHFYRSRIESDRTTIACRRLFFDAETEYLKGNLRRSRLTFEKPGALAAWRDKVLLGVTRTPDGLLTPLADPAARLEHRMFREDQGAQEYTYEEQLRYLQVLNEQYGIEIKR